MSNSSLLFSLMRKSSRASPTQPGTLIAQAPAYAGFGQSSNDSTLPEKTSIPLFFKLIAAAGANNQGIVVEFASK